MRLFPRLLVFLAAAIVAGSLEAASSALIVTGLAGSSSNTEEFQRLAMETKRLLAERGIPQAQIEVLTGKVSREAILEKLRGAAKTSAEDEFWLVLYGHSGKAQGGVPAFQVSGPRLTAADLKETLDAIPARQFVLIGTNESGAFLPVLQNPRRAIISATKGDGESDQPRFPAAWVSALTENPKAAFAWTAARAAELVSQEYEKSSLAQLEHARLADPTTGKILEPPFGVELVAAAEKPAAPGGAVSLASASEIKIKIQDPTAEWEHQPATEETKKTVADAMAVPNPEGYAAIVLDQRLGYTVEEDRTTDQVVAYRVFIAREDAADEWANYFLPQSPPAVTTRLEYARVIQPDGSFIAFNPAKLPGASTPDASGDSARPMVYLPETKAGCVVEIGWRTRQILDATLPHVSESLPLQRSVPILKTSLEVRVPEKPKYNVLLNHFDAQPTERSENGRHIITWQLPRLPAAEDLPGDAPRPLWAMSLGISSLPSWEEFAVWYRRLAQGSDLIDETVKKTAAGIMGDAKSRTEKICRTFEFVSALRYIAIEIGVQGFRPRTPARVLANRYGDCKDKANLIGAMLRSQGIDAQFVLVNRGSFTDVNFPSWQFNHAICYVPRSPNSDQTEDLWLDATDSTAPFGFLPPGDFGRAGLVFSKDKAEFKIIETLQNGENKITLPPSTLASEGLQVAMNPDDFAADDTAWIAAAATTGSSVLLDRTNGADFLAHALRSTKRLGLGALEPASLPATDWPADAVVILRNAENFRPPLLNRLNHFADAGGPLWIFLDGSPEQIAWLKDQGIQATERSAAELPWHLRDWDPEHPILSAFVGESLVPLLEVEFYRGFNLTGDVLSPVANWPDGTIALATANVRGRRLFLAGFPMDRVATNWPVQSSLVPFVHQTVRWLGSLGTARGDWRVGDRIPLASNGIWRTLDSPEVQSERKVSGSVRPTAPGLYEFVAGLNRRVFAVNVPREESDLAPWPDPQQLAALESKEIAQAQTAQTVLPVSHELAENQQRFWWWLLAICGVALFAELALANRTSM